MARTLKSNERLLRIETPALRAPDGTPYAPVPMYIAVDEGAAGGDVCVARMLMPNERIVEIGSTAKRTADGGILPPEPIYIIVDESTVDPDTGISDGEEKLHGNIARALAKKFKQYMDGVEGLGGNAGG
jgi:hypothetical protein